MAPRRGAQQGRTTMVKNPPSPPRNRPPGTGQGPADAEGDPPGQAPRASVEQGCAHGPRQAAGEEAQPRETRVQERACTPKKRPAPKATGRTKVAKGKAHDQGEARAPQVTGEDCAQGSRQAGAEAAPSRSPSSRPRRSRCRARPVVAAAPGKPGAGKPTRGRDRRAPFGQAHRGSRSRKARHAAARTAASSCARSS